MVATYIRAFHGTPYHLRDDFVLRILTVNGERFGFRSDRCSTLAFRIASLLIRVGHSPVVFVDA